MNSIASRLGIRTPGSGGPGRPGDGDGIFPATGDLPRPLDSKAFSKLYRRMDRVVKSMQNPRMNLTRSPPCLIDTLPDIYLKLKDINAFYEPPERKPSLDFNDFFYITVNNIFDKCKRVNQLFKDHKEDIFLETSDSRKQLINLTIVIAYIFADLKALFPDAMFNPHFRIAKEEAERWWKETFPEKIIVPWSTFREKCSQSFLPLSKLEMSKLKSTIDLTCNDHVSIFEFDVFTRLFAPWPMLMKNFKRLTFHPGYMASATFENVKAILSRHKDKPGSYVFRMSCTKLGFWSIGYVTDHSETRRDAISQIVVRDGKPIVEALVEGAQKGFYLYPNGEPSNPDLTDLLHVRPKPMFQVTEAQFEEYSMIGSTFQECKICNLREKDIRLDLCGHFMCSKCLSQWLSKGTGCPFCRCEIRSTQSVTMQPFVPPATSASESHDSGSGGELVSLPQPIHPPPALPPGYASPSSSPPRPGSTCGESGPDPPALPPPRKPSIVSGAPSRTAPLPQPPEAATTDDSEPPPGASSSDCVRPRPRGFSSPALSPTHKAEDARMPAFDSTFDNPDTPYINMAAASREALPLPPPPPAFATVKPSSLSLRAQTDDVDSSRSIPSLVASPLSPADSDVFAQAGDDSGTDMRVLGQLPPPPPIPLESPGATAPPVPSPRPSVLRSPGPKPTPPAKPRLRSRSKEGSPLPQPQSPSLPPPPPTRSGMEHQSPLPSASHPADSVYHIPTEDAYNVPVQEDVYQVPIGEQEENIYNVPIDGPPGAMQVSSPPSN